MLQIVFAAVISATGQLLLKKSINKHPDIFNNGISTQEVTRLVLDPLLLISLTVFAFAVIVWLKVLSSYNLSTAYPILVALSFTIITLVSLVYLKEPVNFYKLMGIIGIVAGIALVVRS